MHNANTLERTTTIAEVITLCFVWPDSNMEAVSSRSHSNTSSGSSGSSGAFGISSNGSSTSSCCGNCTTTSASSSCGNTTTNSSDSNSNSSSSNSSSGISSFFLHLFSKSFRKSSRNSFSLSTIISSLYVRCCTSNALDMLLAICRWIPRMGTLFLSAITFEGGVCMGVEDCTGIDDDDGGGVGWGGLNGADIGVVLLVVRAPPR